MAHGSFFSIAHFTGGLIFHVLRGDLYRPPKWTGFELSHELEGIEFRLMRRLRVDLRAAYAGARAARSKRPSP